MDGGGTTHGDTVPAELARRASIEPGVVAYEFVEDDGSLSRLTFGELAARSEALARRLRLLAAPGGRAVILYPPGLDYVVALLATMSAGLAAVPAYPPTSPRHLGRLHALLAAAQASVVLAAERFGELSRVLSDAGEPAAPWVLGMSAGTGADDPLGVPPGPEDLALVQFTSGSTSAPRGVMLRHAHLTSNLEMIRAAFELRPQDVGVFWLPPYHDMGLVGGILAPLWTGFRIRLMSPMSFIRDPLGWLEQISELGATVAGAPNFAFERCVQRLTREPGRRLDLSSWEVAFTGAEPVRATTLTRFAAAFAAFGFSEHAFYPCYGLAEATLMVSGGRRGAGPLVRTFSRRELERGRATGPAKAADRRSLVSSGRAVPGLAVRVATGDGSSLPAGQVGEIRVNGPSVAAGYWGGTGAAGGTAFVDEDGTAELVTRDLGFLDDDGELFVCGRASDLLVLRGRNVHPEDVELVAEECLDVAGPAVAFGVERVADEALVVLREVPAQDARAAMTARIRSRLGETLDIQPWAVVLVAPGELPRTTSGKMRRNEARRRYLAGELAISLNPAAPDPDQDACARADPALSTLHASVARALGLPPAAVPVTEPATVSGLDSAGAALVAEDLHTRYGLLLSPADLLTGESIAVVARLVRPASSGTCGAAADENHEAVPASPGESAMWVHEGLGEGPSPYVLPVVIDVGPADPEALRSALVDVVARTPSLRTTWTAQDKAVLRRVLPTVPLDLRIDPRGIDSDDELTAVLALAGAVRMRPDLPGGTLRATVFGSGTGRQVLHLAVHHLAADYAAIRLVVADLATCYAARRAGRVPPAPTYTGMTHVLDAERRLLGSPEGGRLRAAWVERLAGAPVSAWLPGARQRTGPMRFEAGTQAVPIRPGTGPMVRALARGDGTTPFVVLAATLHVLLARLSGERDVVLGSPLACRDEPFRRNVVGLLMNTVPLRLDVEPGLSFRELVHREHEVVRQVRADSALPLVRIVDLLGRSGAAAPLYSTMLTVLDAPDGNPVPDTGWRILDQGQTGIAVDAAFDVRLGGSADGDGLRIDLRFARQVLSDAAAARLAQRFALLLDQLLAVPDRKISAVVLTEPLERRRLLSLGSGPPPVLDDVLDQFERVVQRAPDAVAVRAQSEVLTYVQLHCRMSELAGALRVARPRAVAIRLARGPALVVSMLAALAAEVPWVPVDPQTPARQLSVMLRSSRADVLIDDAPPMCADLSSVRVIPSASRGAVLPRKPALSARPAYLMFTSGSTGPPKAVSVPRRALSATLSAVAGLHPVPLRPTLLAATNIGFDISVLEVLLPLTTGGTVVLAHPAGVRDSASLVRMVARERVDLVQGTPSTLAVLLDAGLRLEGVTVLCGGEAAPPGLFGRLLRAGAKAAVNVYGPTETTIWSTAEQVDGPGDPGLGRPLAGESVYVLDAELRPVPVDVEGELCIGGTGVGDGYVDRPGPTAERFVPDPFATPPGARMYRTGDVARWDADGTLRFLGRRDGQLKVHGARVERGEVEVALSEHEAVAECAVVLVNRVAGPVLTAAVRWVPGRRADSGQLRAFLSERLPAYAVPSIFREVDRLPLTERGKLDVAALADAGVVGPPDGDGQEDARPLRAPVETALAEIWAELLRLDRPLVLSDEFFSLGGHSLHAVAVVTEVAKRLERRLTVADVLRKPILADLARHLDGAPRVDATTLPEVVGDGAAGSLGEAQRRLWAFEQLQPATATANIAVMVQLDGPLELAALRTAAHAVLRRHRELRATFPSDTQGRPMRRITAVLAPAVDAVPVAGGRDAAVALLDESVQRPFDVERGPLVRLDLLQVGPDEHLLAVTAHHLVADVTAATLIVRELSEFYGAVMSDAEPPAVEPPQDYSEYVSRLAAQRDPDHDAVDLAWWREKLRGAPRRLFPAPTPGAGANVRNAVLPHAAARALVKYARSSGVTPYMVVVAVLASELSRWTGRSDLVIGTDVGGRDAPGAAHVVGPLVNQVCLRIDTSAPGRVELLAQVRDRVTDALAHSVVSYDRVVAAVAEDTQDRSLFDVKLAYQPAVEDALQLPGIRVSPLPRTPTPPVEALVVFVRERRDGLAVELLHRDDALTRVQADDLLDRLCAGVATWVGQPAPGGRAAETPVGSGFRRRTPRAVAVGESGSSSAEPPVVLAAPGAELGNWLRAHREELPHLLAAHGAVVLRGFDVLDAAAFESAVTATGEPTYLSTEHDRTSLAGTVFTPIRYSRRERLLWHHEDSFRAQWPAHLWFGCVRPADEGGETTIADSRGLLAVLGSTGRRLAAEGVQYVRRFGDRLGQSWQHVFGTADRDEVVEVCRLQGITAAWEGDRLRTQVVLPATHRDPGSGEECLVAQLLHFHPAALSSDAWSSLTALYGEHRLPRDCTFPDGSPIPDEAVHSLVENYETRERACRWRSGDVLLVDNVVAAHGRRPYSGERELMVTMTGLVTHPPKRDHESFPVRTAVDKSAQLGEGAQS